MIDQNAHAKFPNALNRRAVLKAGIGAVAASTAILPFHVKAAQQVVVRSPGGAAEDAFRSAVGEPFTKATGIEVVLLPATTAKMLAMFAAGSAELDVLDIEQAPLLTLARQDALAPLNYETWKFTDSAKIDKNVRNPFYAGNYFFSTILGYNTEEIPVGKQPKSWAEFWDVERFKGARTLPNILTGVVSLELALLADGVAMDKLYPLDVDRAFKSMDRIRSSTRKFWDSGAASVQILTEKEAALGAFFSGRIQAAKDAGAAVEIEWNQQMLQAQVYAIPKNAKNVDNGREFIDFALQPTVQAAYFTKYNYGPSNTDALKSMPANIVAKLPNSPDKLAKSFYMDAAWWDANRAAISERWSQWLLRRT